MFGSGILLATIPAAGVAGAGAVGGAVAGVTGAVVVAGVGGVVELAGRLTRGAAGADVATGKTVGTGVWTTGSGLGATGAAGAALATALPTIPVGLGVV